MSRSIVFVATICFLALQPLACSPWEEASPPNIVIVMVDAMRRDYLGLYGHPGKSSPFLDDLATHSIVFENAYSHCPQTICSTASFFTSKYFPPMITLNLAEQEQEKYQQHQSVRTRGTLNILVRDGRSFPEILAQNGYHTAAFLTNPHHHADSGFPDLFAEPHIYLEVDKGSKGGKKDAVPYFRAERLGQSYLDWLASYDDRSRPFLAYVHFMDPHSPYRPPPQFGSQFVKVEGRDLYTNGVPKSTPTETDLVYMKQLYEAEIAYADSWIERIYKATVEKSSRKTIFVVTADHGDEFMEHGGFGHGRTLYKEQIWIPLLIHGTGHSPARYPHLARHVDLGPTLLNTVGVTAAFGEIDGKNLLPILHQPDSVAPTGARQSVSSSGNWLAVTTPEWHVMKDRRTGAIRLYDNVNDPAGLHDLSEERPEVVANFGQVMASVDEYRISSQRRNYSIKKEYKQRGLLSQPRSEVIEQLRSLGYLQ